MWQPIETAPVAAALMVADLILLVGAAGAALWHGAGDEGAPAIGWTLAAVVAGLNAALLAHLI